MLNRRSLSSWIYLGTTSASTAALVALASRFLNQAEAGLWFSIQVSGAFLLLIDFGIGYPLVRMVTTSIQKSGISIVKNNQVKLYRPSEDDDKSINKLVCGNIGACLSSGLLGLIYFSQVGNYQHYKYLWLSWIIYVLSIAVQIFGIKIRSIMEGCGLLHLERIMLSLGQILYVAPIAASCFLFRSILAMSIAAFFGAICCIILYNLIFSLNSKNSDRRPFILSSMSAMVGESVGLFWVNIGAAATRSAFAPIVTAFLGAAALAPLFFVVKLTGLISTALGVLIMSERAIFMALIADDDIAAVRRKLIQIVATSGGMSLMSAIALIFISPFILRKFGGTGFYLPQVAYVLLGLDMVLNSISAVCGHVVMASGRNPFKLSVFLSGFFTVLLLALLVPKYGILGAVSGPLLAGCLTSYWFNCYQVWLVIKSKPNVL